MITATGPLKRLRVIDLSRVLAGPVCTQILGDLGADVIKIEKPGPCGQGGGDDTRGWGPPFLKDAQGNDTTESAYYLCANRNKRSVGIDLATEQGRADLHRLLAEADVFIQNFKVGSLDKLGFGYDDLQARYPRLVYCAITGFGQTGPMAHEPGYDFMIQGLSGFMSVTGAADGVPSKAGVAIVDYITGLNAAIAILAALRVRDETGKGQMIDMALFDSALAMMTNIAQYALISGHNPPRMGNAHTTIMPYNAFAASDGWVILAVGNDHQFEKFAQVAGHPEWAKDPRFAKNSDRVIHRDVLTQLIAAVISTRSCAEWIDHLIPMGVPCGPVNSMTQALSMPQTAARDMIIDMPHPLAPVPVKMVGSPFRFSDTPVNYRYAPPTSSQHQKDILE